MEAPVRTTCPYCGVGCGVIARVGADGQVSVKGDPDHPATLARDTPNRLPDKVP